MTMTQKEAFNNYYPLIKNNGKVYSKYSLIRAYIALGGEYIETWTSDGLETTNVAKPGDFIVQNLQTESMEQYIISPSMFHKRYKFFYYDNTGAIYIPVGKVFACQYQGETTKFIANWGREMVLKPGDYIACPFPESREVYRIASKEFYETYNFYSD